MGFVGQGYFLTSVRHHFRPCSRLRQEPDQRMPLSSEMIEYQ